VSTVRQPGAALRSALEERGCALRADEARALADSLISLICAGVIVADEGFQTAPANNMGQSVCITEESK
jgi:hypothetical protein